MGRLGQSQRLLSGVADKQLLPGNTNVLAAVLRVNIGRVGLKPIRIAVKLFVLPLRLGQLDGIRDDLDLNGRAAVGRRKITRPAVRKGGRYETIRRQVEDASADRIKGSAASPVVPAVVGASGGKGRRMPRTKGAKLLRIHWFGPRDTAARRPADPEFRRLRHPWLVQRIGVCILAVTMKIADNQIG